MTWFGEYSVSLITITAVAAFVLARYFHTTFLDWLKGDVVDSATGLSRREKRLVQDSWNIVRKDLKTTGTGLFFALFSAYPEYQRFFKSFSDVPVQELMDSSFFVAHAMNVANAINLVVDSLDDAPTLVAILRRTGRSHGKHKITETHFLNLATVVVNFLEKSIGKNKFTDSVRKSWLHTLEVALSVIKTEL